MGYVAVKGGQVAIDHAAKLVEYYRVRERTEPVAIGQIRSQMRLLVDKVMGEGSLYAPEHAALAIKQVEGDVFEAAFILRAYRATLDRRYYSDILDTRQILLERRISSAFRDIPGGQILGPTRDYSQRLLEPRLVNETLGSIDTFLRDFRDCIDPGKLRGVTTFRKVIDLLTAQGLMRADLFPEEDRRVVDVTREAIKFPAPRSAALQMLARGETASMMCLAYSTMRGFGGGHSLVGELRVGRVPVRVSDAAGRNRYIGNIRLTEVETIGRMRTSKKDAIPYITMGYGLCFGQNETKGIAMGTLDSAMRRPDDRPANSQEFVLYHTECIESYGFTNHWKLPHYVTFQSGLDNLRRTIRSAGGRRAQTRSEYAGATHQEK
jgi:alpha-D-ribose 1-methylphosphonate 5-triphosphate synthase subunit PhnI